MSRRKIATVALFGAMVLAVTANAAGSGADYQGRAEHDSTTYVGFDLNQGKTKLNHFSSVLNFHCPGNGTPVQLQGRTSGSLKIRKKHFSGKLKAPILFRGSSPQLTYKIKGKLLKHGKAKGTVDATSPLIKMRSARSTYCYTGRLDWKVKRGANVIVALPKEKH